jgi:gliding motility-associated-like protein
MKKLLTILLGIFFITTKITAQVGVGPAPYCMPLYSQIPCNQPWPSNTPGNGINDFIHSYNTNGATFNIVNNGSGCNAQNLAGTKNYRFWGCQYYMRTSPGQVITSNFQSGNVYAQGCTVFVDWNNDGVYNPITERMTSTAGVPPAAVMTPMPAWTVPVVPNGIYRMRVRCAYFTNGPTIDPCMNYGYGETEEYNVYVNTTPNTMTVTLTSNSPVCVGNVININTAVTLAPGAGTCVAAIPSFTYAWTGPMSFTSNVMNPSFTATNVLQSGVYTLNISPGTCGCNSTNTIQIWVNPNPSTSITNNGPVCQGSPLNFTNIVTGGGTPTYSWTGPNSYTNNTQNISFASAQPSLSGIYNFTVVNTFINGGSCMATSSSSVAVVPVAQVSVTSSYTQCQGTSINLNANVNGASSFTWTGPSFTSNLQNPILSNSTPTMSGNYTVTAAFTSTQTTLVCSSSAVSNVSIVPMNPVNVSVTQDVCQGTNVTFSANANANPTYSWTGPNNYTSTNQSNTINNISPLSAGIYTVKAIWSIGTVSCITSNMTNILVVPVNSIMVTPTITLCEKNGCQFTASSNGAVSYTWTGPGGFNVATPNPQFVNLTPSWSGIYTVTALYTDGNINCYNTNFTNLLVKPIIQFSLTPIGKLCFNQTLNVPGPIGATSYTWTGPNFTSNTQNLYLPNASTINIGTYNLVVDLNGCQTFGSIFVDVQDPIVWKNVPQNQTICKGDSFTLTAEAGHGSGNYAYNWNPFYNITGPTGSVQAGVGQGTTVYNISVYDIACPQYTINHSFVLNVNHAPVPNLSVPNNQCEPFCTIYNSHIKNQSELVSYSFNGGNVYYGDSTNICLSAGIYTVDVMSKGLNGCSETFSYPNMITVYPKPTADFNWNPSTPNTVSDNRVTFYPLNQNNNSTYFWELAANTTTTDKTPTVVYENQGKYPITLVVISEHGCKDTLTKVLEIKDEFIMWVPNAFTPNNDGLNETFTAKGLGIKKFEMTIHDRWGNMIFQTDDIHKGWDGTFKGTICQDNVFVYRIVALDNNNMKHTKTGHVTLLK